MVVFPASMKDQILEEIHYLQDKIEQVKKAYNEKDVRLSFFDGSHSIMCHFLLHFEIPNNDFFESIYRAIHKSETLRNSDLKMQLYNIRNNANSTLIIDSWSNFELMVTYLSDKSLDLSTKTEMLEKDYNDLVKCLKKNGVDASNFECIVKRKQTNYHLIQSNLKINKLLSSIKKKYKSKEELKEVREFLLNFGRLRNCIHSNYIFHRRDQIEYNFENVTMKYIPNEPIIVDPITYEFIFRMVVRLREIAEFIIDSVDYSDDIIDPSFLLIE